MKKNSFKYTFYFGLIIILFLCGFITSVSINIYSSLHNRIQTKKQDTIVNELPPLPPEKEVIHDTVVVEKIVLKPVDSSKPKKEKDTTLSQDSAVN